MDPKVRVSEKELAAFASAWADFKAKAKIDLGTGLVPIWVFRTIVEKYTDNLNSQKTDDKS